METTHNDARSKTDLFRHFAWGSFVTMIFLSPLVIHVLTNIHQPAPLPVSRAFSIKVEPIIPPKVKWRTFSLAEVEEAIDNDEIVLIDVYGTWDAISMGNQINALAATRVHRKLLDESVVAFRGDFTYEDPEIRKFMNAVGEDTVPLVVIFSRATLNDPVLFPGPLSEQMVIDGIDLVVCKERNRLKLSIRLQTQALSRTCYDIYNTARCLPLTTLASVLTMIDWF